MSMDVGEDPLKIVHLLRVHPIWQHTEHLKQIFSEYNSSHPTTIDRELNGVLEIRLPVMDELYPLFISLI
jgi:hypothetical protein